MRKNLHVASASALAAATIAASLGCGPAALATVTPAATASESRSSLPADGTRFQLISEVEGKFWAQSSNMNLSAYSTRAAAEAIAPTLTVEIVGDSFRARYLNGSYPNYCLYQTLGSKPFLNTASYCTGDDSLFHIDSSGRLVGKRAGLYVAETPNVLSSNGINSYGLISEGPAAHFEGINSGLQARVDKVDLANRSALLSGTAKPNSIIIIGENQQTDVDESGTWSATVRGLHLGDNTVHLENWVGTTKDSEKDLTVALTVADLTASASAGTSDTDDVTLSGAGQTGAAVTIKDPAGTTLATTTVDASGRYAAQVAAPNRAGTQTFTVTQTVGGTAAGSVETTFDYGTGVTVTSPVNDFIHPGGPLDFAGKGQPGGTVTIREEGKQGVIASGTVLVNGNWAITDVNLDALEHKLVISQLSTGNNTTTTKLTLSPGASPVIVPPTVVSPPTGSTTDVSRPTFTGTGEPGATLTIGYGTNLIGTTTVTRAGQWTLYPTAGLALGRSDLTVTQTAGTDVKTLDYVITRVVTEPPFRVTSHTNNQTYAEGDTTFRGTSATGATIRAVNQWGTVMGTTTADAKGNWAFTRYLGPTTGGYDITFSATKAGKVETQTLHLTYQGALAFAVTSPTNNSTYKTGDTTFVGKASPNTTIKAVNQWGTPMGTTTSNLEGNWSFVRYLGPTSTGYDITFTATKGTDTQRTVLHLNPELVNVPVSVTSIKDGDTYLPGENILKGKGTPGATVSAVNATNGWNVPMGSAKVDSTGNWALPSRNWGPANDYQIKVTQTNPDKSTSTVTVNVKAPRFAALTVDGVTIGGQVGPGVVATFVGKATPGSSIAVKSALTGSTYQTVTTGITGTWSALRAWDPTHTYNLVFEQTAPDGTIDTVNYGAFTTAK